jgi:arylsulfatase A-like enzyme
LLPADVKPHPVVAETKEWSEIQHDERKWSAKMMEVFAAMVDRMDWNIGRVISYLEEAGEKDKTFIFSCLTTALKGQSLKLSQ